MEIKNIDYCNYITSEISEIEKHKYSIVIVTQPCHHQIVPQ